MISEIVHGLSFDKYRARPGLSISQLKEMARSPLHYRHALSNRKETPALALGQAAHCATLEPERFDASYSVWSRRTKSGNLAPRNGKHWNSFREANASRSIISEDEHAEATGIRDAVRAHPEAMKYLRTGSAEVSMFWGFNGRQCRGRIDWLHESEEIGTALVGLKSTRDCRQRPFGWQAERLGYHLQWAFYWDGWRALHGRTPDRVVEICVESKPPHAVAVYRIPDEVLQRGAEEYMTLLETLDECERANRWPGPNEAEQDLILPSRDYEEIEAIEYVDE